MAVVQECLKEFPNRKTACKFIRNETNIGVASSRNVGLAIAEGKYVYFCDSDDYIDETMLEKMFLKAESSFADVVFCDFYFSYADAKEYYSAIKWSEDKIASLKSYIISPWTVLWNMLVRRDIYEKNKIEFIDGCGFCEDFNVAVKVLFVADKVVNIDKALYYYNQFNPKSAIRSYNEKSFRDEQCVYLDVIEWFKLRNAYSDFSQELCWRILKILQVFILKSKYTEFLSFTPPEVRFYIGSCPYVNAKLKIMMWSLFHHLGFVARFMIALRNIRLYVVKL